ncbi:hypothetical protein HY947_02590 [Candidatus Gottesmanbacteria bacterium]|nr:hypothetical protein [Candidatus Gottesmanbacteria bacterium]
MKLFQKDSIFQCIVFLFITFVVLATYHGVFFTFFQQDEWQNYGHHLLKGAGVLFDTDRGQNLLKLFFAEGRVLSEVMYLLLYGISRFSVVPIFIFSIFVQVINSYLVFILGKNISKSLFFGIIASLFFAVNSVSSQAVTWAAAVGTLPAATFLLFSLLLYVEYLEGGNTRKRNFSYFLGILSLFFKETGLFIFVLYPLLYLLWGKVKKIQDIFLVHAPLLLYGIALVLFRMYELLSAPKSAAGFVGPDSGGFILPMLYHSIVNPMISLIQMFIPPLDIYAFIPTIVRSEYRMLVGSPMFDLVGQSAVTDVVSLAGSMIVLFILGGMLLAEKNENYAKKTLTFGLLLFWLSFLPYAVLHKEFSYMSSRYYYVGAIGAAIVFGYLVDWFLCRVHFIGKSFIFGLVGIFLVHQMQSIQNDIRPQIVLANERKNYLNEIKRVHPKLENKTIFYITSDKKFLGEITYPFQNGLGYILEVQYYNTGKIPRSFLATDFLWDLGSEGFRDENGSIFGYFEHLDLIGAAVKEGKISPQIVYSYIYNSKTHTMSDISLSVREQLATLSGSLQ